MQNWTEDTYSGTNPGATDLQNIENNFQVIKSLWSGTTAPSIGVVAGTPWFDTSKKLLKYRNAANSDWIGLMHGDTSQKIVVYRNAAMDGWAIDSSVTDKIIALKGGSTYITGGIDSQGSWTISGLSGGGTHTHTGPSHNHIWYKNKGTTENDEDGQSRDLTHGASKSGAQEYILASDSGGDPIRTGTSTNLYTSNSGTGDTGAAGTSPTHDGSWRPAAAVVTLQYLDI